MGLLDNQTQSAWYSSLPKGDYQFTSMDNIISGFMVAYVGEDKLISKVSRTDVQFHAMRAIQELSYDVFRSVKSQEIEVPASLRMGLPQDYVNYVKIVRVDGNGIERVLYPTGKTSNPFAINQDADGVYQFTDGDGDGIYAELSEQGTTSFESNTWTNYQDQTETDVYSDDSTDIEIDNRGRRYGLDPQHTQYNGTFFIDQRTGYIHFGSALSGRSNIPEYLVQRFKKEKFAETRKAKIRLSNIKIY